MISTHLVQSVFSLFPGEQHAQGEFYFTFWFLALLLVFRYILYTLHTDKQKANNAL